MTETKCIVPAHRQGMMLAQQRSQFAVSNGLNNDDDMKIRNFMTWHTSRVKKGRRDIPVKELRTIIPAFILRCFAMKEDQPTQKKVKGLWEKPPNGWNPSVPFLDPNNKGDQGKPKKEVLMQMFEYLVKVYQRNGNAAIDLTKGPVQVSDELMDPVETGEQRSVEVSDEMCEFDWSPLDDCKQRIKQKLHALQGVIYLSDGDVGMLNVTNDMLFRLFDQLDTKDSLEYAHSFECSLDIVKATNNLPIEVKQKWQEFEVEGNKLDTASCTLEEDNVLNYEYIKELGISPQSNPLLSDQMTPFRNNLTLRDLGKIMCTEDTFQSDCKKVEDNKTKFAFAEDLITDEPDGASLNEIVDLVDCHIGCLPEDDALDWLTTMFDEGNDGNTLKTTSDPDLSDYLTSNIDWELAEDDGALDTQTQGNICENVHTPRCDDKWYEEGASIQCRERKNSMESIDSDHSYVQKTYVVPENTPPWSVQSPTNNMCDQVEQLSISSPNVETTDREERGTKRGYSDTRNDFEPKHRRTEDMDTWEDEGDQPSYGEWIF